MPKKYRIHLTAAERLELKALVTAGKAAAPKRLQAQILLAADGDHPKGALKDAEIIRALGVSICTVERTRCALAEHGLQDLHVFAKSKQEAYNHFSFLAQILFNEDLSLQKTTRRILTTDELRDASSHLDLVGTADAAALPPEAKLMRRSLRFDSYSPMAEEDFDSL